MSKDKDKDKSKHDDAVGHGSGKKSDGHGSGKKSDGHGSGKKSDGDGSGKASGGHGSGKASGSHGSNGSDGGDDGYLSGGAVLNDDAFDLVYEDLQLVRDDDSFRSLSIDVLSDDSGIWDTPDTNWIADATLLPGLSFAAVSDPLAPLDPNIQISWNAATTNFDLIWNDAYPPRDASVATADIEFDYQLLFNGEVDAAVDPGSVDIFFNA